VATPTLISVSNVALPNLADSGNVAVTIPSGANACVIGGTYYVTDSSVITSITGSVFSSTTNGGLRVNNPTGGTYMGSYAQAFKVTATGSQTVRVQKTGNYSEGPTCQIGWFTVDDADNFVPSGGFSVVQQTGSPQALAATVNSNSTDYVFGMFGTDGSSADPTAPTGTTLQGTMQTTQFDKSIAFSVNSPGASTTTVTAGSRDFPSLCLISLRGTGGGPTSHASSGALVGPGAVVAGTAARTRAHGATGALTGPGSAIVGSARHNIPHASSGDLVGPGSTLSGAAARTRQHASSGDLIGPGSTVVGAAARTRAHASSGALTGPGSEVVGVAARTRQHDSSGALTGPGAIIVGAADHQAAAGSHYATGALVGLGSVIAGSASRKRTFASSGALVGPGAIVTGSAARVAGSVSHDATGSLVGPGSIINGTAARANPPVSHNATGALIGPGSIVVGEARNGAEEPQVGIFWPPFWWYKNEELEEELEKLAPEVKEVIIEAAEKAINDEPVEIRAELKKEKIRYRNQYKEIYLRIVEEMRQSEEDEEIAAIVAFL